MCVQAADQLREEQGLSFDVLDLRSIFPYDWKAIRASVLKTGRVLIVNEDTEVTNFGEHLLRRVVDEHFYDLLVRPRMLLGKHMPGIGLNQVYERNRVPQLPNIRRRCASWRRSRAEPRRNRISDVSEHPMDFPLPQLGEGVYEAELVRWLVKPGERSSPAKDSWKC